MKILFIFILLSTTLHAEEESEVSNVGPDKGVLEASQKTGFKLIANSVAHLGIKAEKAKLDGGFWVISPSSLVTAKKEFFIYLLNEGFYRPVEVMVQKKSGGMVYVKPEHGEHQAGLPSGLVVTHGVHFLRNIETDIFSSEEGGHHH